MLIYTNLLKIISKNAKDLYLNLLITDGGDGDLKIQKYTIGRLANDVKAQFLFNGKLMKSQDKCNRTICDSGSTRKYQVINIP